MFPRRRRPPDGQRGEEFAMSKWLVIALALVVCSAGCQQPAQRLNAPPHGYAERQADLAVEYAHMIDNALLENMTISDVHFLPHRAQLNSLGEERVARLALLMELYGGTIRFSTNETEELAAARTRTILEFLEDTGAEVTAQSLVPDMAGGRGIDAAQAVLIRKYEATYQPKKGSGSGSGAATSGVPTTK
jgi:hypothetical protein